MKSVNGYLVKFAMMRNNFLKPLEYLFIFQNGLLVLFTTILLICGVSCLMSKEFSSQKFGFTSLKGAMIFLVIYYTLMLKILGVVVIIIARNRNMGMKRIFSWGIFLFLFGCLVLFGEGVELLNFVNMDDSDFESMCKFNVSDIEDQQKWV